MSEIQQIFVVGCSRSGTTMMGRILANNTEIFTFKELHFFGTIWANKSNQALTKDDQIKLLSRLFCIQQNGLFNQNSISGFDARSEKLISGRKKNPLEIYKLFLETIAKENNCRIFCEQTPKNLYYLEEILLFFPNAKVINLVRDQRDVLLSQKNKWKRRYLGSKAFPLFETFRSFINYHPILTAKVWNSSLSYTAKYLDHPNIKLVYFEDLLANSENVVKDICKFLQIDFQNKMLKVPIVGSSIQKDSKLELAIDTSRISNWDKGGLSNAEIYLSQKISSEMMNKFGYKKKFFSLPPIFFVSYLISLPMKLLLAFLFNIRRMSNIVEVIKKRFFFR